MLSLRMKCVKLATSDIFFKDFIFIDVYVCVRQRELVHVSTIPTEASRGLQLSLIQSDAQLECQELSPGPLEERLSPPN